MSSPQTLRLGADVGFPCGMKRRRHDNYCTPAKFGKKLNNDRHDILYDCSKSQMKKL